MIPIMAESPSKNLDVTSWLKSGDIIFLKTDKDNCFIIQHIDNKAQIY